MSTSYPRTVVTRTPRVERILAAGRERWPGRTDGAVLVALAEEAVDKPSRHTHLVTFDVPGVVTAAMVAEALDDE